MKLQNVEKYILILGIFAIFLWVMFPFIQSILLALLLSAVLSKGVLWLERRCRFRRGLASLVVSLLFSACVLVPLLLLLIFVGRELFSASRAMEEFLSNRNLAPLEIIETLRLKLSLPDMNLSDRWGGVLTRFGEASANFVGNLVSSLPQLAIELFIFVLSLYTFLVNFEPIREMIRSLLPFDADEFEEFAVATEGIFRGVIFSALAAGLVQGTLIGLGYWILDVPKPLLFAALTAFLSLVPLLGTGPTGIGAAIYLVLQERYVAALVMLGIFAIASFSDNIVKPIVLKGAAELNPLLALLGAFGGLAAFGFIGLFLGPLIMALTVIAVKLYVDLKREVA